MKQRMQPQHPMASFLQKQTKPRSRMVIQGYWPGDSPGHSEASKKGWDKRGRGQQITNPKHKEWKVSKKVLTHKRSYYKQITTFTYKTPDKKEIEILYFETRFSHGNQSFEVDVVFKGTFNVVLPPTIAYKRSFYSKTAAHKYIKKLQTELPIKYILGEL